MFLGTPGVGKTHVVISLAIAAAEHGRRVYYGSLRDLIESLQEAEAKGQLRRRLRVLTHPALLVVDEIGYLPVTRNGATLFFQLINERYERASTVLTSNKGFEEWGAILGDEVMAAALLGPSAAPVPGEKEPRGSTGPARGDLRVKGEARRPPNSGRSAPSVGGLRAGLPRHALPAHHLPVELPARNRQPIRKSVQFSMPKSVKFSMPIDMPHGRIE